MKTPVILIVGTLDTKSHEISFMRDQVLAAGGQARIMDVGVLAKGLVTPDISHAEVAQAAGVRLQQVIESGDENTAMAWMAKGASRLALQWHREGRMDGLLVLGAPWAPIWPWMWPAACRWVFPSWCCRPWRFHRFCHRSACPLI